MVPFPLGHCLLYRSFDIANNDLFDVFRWFLLFSVALSIMVPAPFVPDPKYFGKDPDGICGLEMAEKAGFSFGDSEAVLIPLVVSGRPPAPSKAKLQYGHHVTQAIAKHHGASSPFFFTDQSLFFSQLKAETLTWNPAASDTFKFQLDRLHSLRSEPAGGVLAIFKHWNPVTKTFGSPVLRVVACPAVATLGSFSSSASDPPGLNLQEAWDTSVSPPLLDLPDDTICCPVMASAGGFSRAIADPTLDNFLRETEPLFIPHGEELAGTVRNDTGDVLLRSWFLPTHSHLPIGMAWSLENLTTEILISSVKALAKPPGALAFKPFISVLATLAPRLDLWLVAAQANADSFATHAFPFTVLRAHFPDLVTGAFPDSIACSTTFAPLVDMLYIYGCRLALDKLFSGPLGADIAYMRTFLARAASCLHPDTYMGAKLLPELAPNIFYHFKSHGGWPTGTSPVSDFSRNEIVSFVAQTYETIPIEVHPNRPAPLPSCKLVTVAAASALRHQQQTPKYSQAPVDLSQLATSFAPAARVPAPAPAPASPVPGSAASSSINLLSPPKTHSLLKVTEGPTTPAGAKLFVSQVYSPPVSSSKANQPAAVRALSALMAPAQTTAIPKWSEILNWKLDSATHRTECAMEFLHICFLLAHGPAELVIDNERNLRYLKPYVLFARGPSELARLRILMPVFSGSHPDQVDPVRTLIQGMIDQQGEGIFTRSYTSQFFQARTLRALLQIPSWNMDESFDTSQSDSGSFTIYGFLKALRSHGHSPALLPTEGLSLLEAKQVAQFILAWFRSLDVPYGLDTAKFDASILGSRLLYLSSILDRHNVHSLWEHGGRKAMTFVWLKHVRALLHLFQRLVTASSVKAGAGFLITSPVTLDPFNRDGQHFLDAIQEFDRSVHVQWRAGRLLSSQAFYDLALLPSCHFIAAPRPPPLTQREQPPTRDADTKKRSNASSSSTSGPNNFTAVHNLFDLAGSNPNNRGGVAARFLGINPPSNPMPKLLGPGQNGQPGKLTLLCFPSSVGAPFNTCCTSECLRGQSSRKKNSRFKRDDTASPFLHVDLNLPFFSEQPESYWATVVSWLRLPGVSAAILPSKFLKAKTPSTPW